MAWEAATLAMALPSAVLHRNTVATCQPFILLCLRAISRINWKSWLVKPWYWKLEIGNMPLLTFGQDPMVLNSRGKDVVFARVGAEKAGKYTLTVTSEVGCTTSRTLNLKVTSAEDLEKAASTQTVSQAETAVKITNQIFQQGFILILPVRSSICQSTRQGVPSFRLASMPSMVDLLCQTWSNKPWMPIQWKNQFHWSFRLEFTM